MCPWAGPTPLKRQGSEPSPLSQGLPDIGHDIVNMFQADGDPHHPIGYSHGFPVLPGEFAMGSGGGMGHDAAGIPQIGGKGEQVYGVEEFLSGLKSPLDLKAHYGP